MNGKSNRLRIFILIAGMVITNAACVGHFLPDSLDAYDKEAAFNTRIYRPQLGKTTLMSNNFNAGNSTLPFTFEITSIRRADGTPAPELTEYFPVKTWTSPYTAEEKSLAEIEAKRATEYRQLFQVRKHSGEFIMWANARSSFVLCAPTDGYVFDVLAQNSGGYAYTASMSLIPVREMDYEPSNIDPDTGIDTCSYVHPLGTNRYVVFDSTGWLMNPQDIQIYFWQDIGNTAPEKTLTFRFYGPDYEPLDPAVFNTTDWGTLVHGFDMEKTDTYVRYKVAYPIPLTTIPSRYNNKNGDMAHIVLKYDRMTGHGRREEANITFDFAIYTEGHWEISFVFAKGLPKFADGR